MTEAGWTAGKDVKEVGWYWWDEKGLPIKAVQIEKGFTFSKRDGIGRDVMYVVGYGGLLEDKPGRFKGPISPTDRQQGFQDGCVEGLRRAGIAYAQWINNEYRPSAYARFEDWCEMEAQLIAQAAQAAQDEKGVGDAQ